MTCQEFLARYSEYLDERMDAMEAARWRRHVESCPPCARYDRILRRGLPLMQSLPHVEPSSDFFPRLQHRLFHLEDELRAARRSSGGGVVLSLAIAGTLAILAWGPLVGPRVPESNVAPVEPRVPVRLDEARRGPSSGGDARRDLATHATTVVWPDSEWWAVPATARALVSPRGALVPVNGLYSPLIVAPPNIDAVRAVSRSGWGGALPARR